ncbi:MAG TPA: hypothetical protein VKJ65_13950, partial [Phycisphaerae bacterium]|nr:hypothetical protein [Phycisphaerae bacterium]
LILLPFIMFVLVAGMAVLIGGLISPALGHIAAIPAGWLLNIQGWLVSHLASLPGSNFIVRAPPALLIILIYAVIGAWIFRAKLRIPRMVIAGVFAIWLIVLTAYYKIADSNQPTQLWVLDAGDGNALVLQTPGGKTVAIDAGSLGSPEHVADMIDQLLRVCGRRGISDAVITQVDSAHAGAMAALIGGDGSVKLYCDASALADGAQTYETKRFFGDQNFSGSVFSPLQAGSHININANTSIDVLWPGENISAAERSIRGCVMLLHLNGRSVLILDRTQISRAVEDSLSNLTEPDALILLGPGTLKPGDRTWLGKLNPGLIVLSGESREAVQTDSSILSGRQFFQTTNSGAVELASEPDGIHVVNWAN